MKFTILFKEIRENYHIFQGNPSNLPFICIVWFPPNMGRIEGSLITHKIAKLISSQWRKDKWHRNKCSRHLSILDTLSTMSNDNSTQINHGILIREILENYNMFQGNPWNWPFICISLSRPKHLKSKKKAVWTAWHFPYSIFVIPKKWQSRLACLAEWVYIMRTTVKRYGQLEGLESKKCTSTRWANGVIAVITPINGREIMDNWGYTP